MNTLTRDEAHLLLGAIRVLGHRGHQPPTPEEIADLLEMSPSGVRLQLDQLRELGAVALVVNANQTRAEVRDHLLIESLPEKAGPAISDDLKEFDRRKQEEADRMSRLFDSGDHEKQRRQKIQDMDQKLKGFQRKKPPNPFGDD